MWSAGAGVGALLAKVCPVWTQMGKEVFVSGWRRLRQRRRVCDYTTFIDFSDSLASRLVFLRLHANKSWWLSDENRRRLLGRSHSLAQREKCARARHRMNPLNLMAGCRPLAIGQGFSRARARFRALELSAVFSLQPARALRAAPNSRRLTGKPTKGGLRSESGSSEAHAHMAAVQSSRSVQD